MKIRCAFACLALFLTIIPGALQVQAEDGDLSEKEKLWGLMQVWAEAKFNFPFFDQVPDLDWDASVQEYIPRVIAAEDTVLRLGSRGTKQADEALGLLTFLYGPSGSAVSMKVKDMDGTERDVTLIRATLDTTCRPTARRSTNLRGRSEAIS